MTLADSTDASRLYPSIKEADVSSVIISVPKMSSAHRFRHPRRAVPYPTRRYRHGNPALELQRAYEEGRFDEVQRLYRNQQERERQHEEKEHFHTLVRALPRSMTMQADEAGQMEAVNSYIRRLTLVLARHMSKTPATVGPPVVESTSCLDSGADILALACAELGDVPADYSLPQDEGQCEIPANTQYGSMPLSTSESSDLFNANPAEIASEAALEQNSMEEKKDYLQKELNYFDSILQSYFEHIEAGQMEAVNSYIRRLTLVLARHMSKTSAMVCPPPPVGASTSCPDSGADILALACAELGDVQADYSLPRDEGQCEIPANTHYGSMPLSTSESSDLFNANPAEIASEAALEKDSMEGQNDYLQKELNYFDSILQSYFEQ